MTIETIYPFADPCDITYDVSFATRTGYNVGGDSFANAPLVPAFPTTYLGSMYDGRNPFAGGISIDPGQYYKVRLKCNQAMYSYGFVTVSGTVSSNFRVDIYDANQQLIVPNWIFTGSMGTTNFASTPFVNPNSTDTDFYIRAWSYTNPVYDFTLNIDEYIASNSSTNPRPVAPDATGSGGSVSSEEYHLPAGLDADVLTGRNTELWAKMYWPTSFSGGPYPLVVFLHGNHNTCGRALTSPRIDDDNGYTYSGTCGASPFFVNGIAGTARNDAAGWFGMKITTGSQALIVRSLGRIFITNNTGTHTIRIIRASDNAQMGSVSLSMLGGTNKQIKYQTLAASVTLAASTSYYIVSQEVLGGDQWYDSNSTIIGTGAATVNGSASSPDGTTWSIGSTLGRTYGLVDFDYDFTNAPGRSVVPNHLGYEYLATQLASRGYIVASINANRGITGAATPDSAYPDDPTHIFSRGRLVLKHLETLSKWNSGGQALITPTTFGTLRRNSNNWFGMKITIGSKPITVYALGRIFLSGNTGTHTVKIVRASNGTDVPNGSVAIPMTGGPIGPFKYVNLATPVSLAANTSYYIASKEVNNGDYWYDSNTIVSSTSVATVDGRVSSTNGATWSTSGAVAGKVYVPVDFKYQALSVNLTGKVDFSNVGLMGHSRGGQGVLAAYNLYRNSSIDPRGSISPTWSNRIPGMNIKGIFEIGPTDFPLQPPSGGSALQYLNGDGTAWNVLLPMCDGDVYNLQGVRVFDRMMAYTGGYSPLPADSPTTQKSTFTVWGTNHNFYNTEWQQSEGLAVCRGTGNTPLFSNPAVDGSGSPNEQTMASASLLAFFRANVGASPSSTFNQNFNPRYALAPVATSITRVDQGFTPSPSLSVTKILFDFLPSGWPSDTSVDSLNITPPVYTTASDHDYTTNPIPVPTPSPAAQILNVGLIGWSTAACNNYFQANWKLPGSGDNIGGYQTLDFRISRKNDPNNPSGATNLQIQLIGADGNPTGSAVSLNKYISLTGPVGIQDVAVQDDGLHPILQTVRIPLTDFTNANLLQVRGVRFIFSDTATGAIYLGNLRLSSLP